MNKNSTDYDCTKIRRNHSGNDKLAKSYTSGPLSTILSSQGNDVYDCQTNFINEDVLYEDFGSLSAADLEKLGITDARRRNELLQEFSELPKQDCTLKRLMNSRKSEDVNNQIFDRCLSYAEDMRLALTIADMKLRSEPSADIIVDDGHYASKFAVDAVAELMKITEDIENRLELLELICCEQKSHTTVWKIVGLASLIGLGIACLIKRF